MSSRSQSPIRRSEEIEQNSNSNKNYAEGESEGSDSVIDYNGYQSQPQELNEESKSVASLGTRTSILEKVQSKYSFFNEKLKSRRKSLALKFLLTYLVMAVFVLAVFSIYWGSMYQRNSKLKNLRMLVVIEDDKTVNGVKPLIGNTIESLVHSDEAGEIGDWHVFNSSEFAKIAAKHDNNIEQELERQIHHQNYWSSIYVKPNATYNLNNAISKGESNYDVSNSSIVVIYETGRDFQAMGTYVTPQIEKIERMWLSSQSNVSSALLKSMSHKSDVLSNSKSMKVFATPASFAYYDRAPFTNPVILAPSQVGLIYIIIITLFQLNFFSEIHQQVATYNLKPLHYILYRYFSSMVSFFILSLFYSFVTLAMQVDLQKAFGKAGFLVYWMISFITMCAVGYMNEIVALFLIPTYPPLIGFWMLFWVVSNIAPTFAPIALCAKFFRYGYAMPIHNSYEANKVILFNTYKGELGRNIGILIAWNVIALLIYPFALKFMGQKMKKKAMAAAAAAAAAQNNK